MQKQHTVVSPDPTLKRPIVAYAFLEVRTVPLSGLQVGFDVIIPTVAHRVGKL